MQIPLVSGLSLVNSFFNFKISHDSISLCVANFYNTSTLTNKQITKILILKQKIIFLYFCLLINFTIYQIYLFKCFSPSHRKVLNLWPEPFSEFNFSPDTSTLGWALVANAKYVQFSRFGSNTDWIYTLRCWIRSYSKNDMNAFKNVRFKHYRYKVQRHCFFLYSFYSTDKSAGCKVYFLITRCMSFCY